MGATQHRRHRQWQRHGQGHRTRPQALASPGALRQLRHPPNRQQPGRECDPPDRHRQEELVDCRLKRAGRRAAAIQNLFATAKLNGLDPARCLADTLKDCQPARTARSIPCCHLPTLYRLNCAVKVGRRDAYLGCEQNELSSASSAALRRMRCLNSSSRCVLYTSRKSKRNVNVLMER